MTYSLLALYLVCADRNLSGGPVGVWEARWEGRWEIAILGSALIVYSCLTLC